jgi:hypothetical protein
MDVPEFSIIDSRFFFNKIFQIIIKNIFKSELIQRLSLKDGILARNYGISAVFFLNLQNARRPRIWYLVIP